MVAGFRIGRGHRSRGAQQQGQQYGQQPYGAQGQRGGPPPPGYGPGPGPAPGGYGGQGGFPPPAHGEPEYFGGGGGGGGRGRDPYYPDNAGHTHPYGVGEAPDAYGQGGYGYDDGGHGGHGGQYGENTYRAGSAPAPVGPKLHWKELLRGIVFHPNRTFWQMRDHKMWGPALIVTFLYGLLAVFGLDAAREDVLNSTLANSVPWVISTGIAVVIAGLVLGAVTHTLARQLGGDGAWEPTVGLSMLIMSITDAPRLIVAMFAGGQATISQALGWATWIAAGALLTSMVSKSHDLPWPRALAASSIQLIAMLAIMKLGTV
ncbi:YIP1 family protein [Streptomyces sp. A7024]|uniref:YIP1 family protein n=1 Tax=Streptomyces coryli TaxID=1128680 RepID=A0A6G4TXS9_9ACTN|nr:Yip1 family protein [Streptomyces coryli]NGN64623.1 YIP1 family protein [Streptomyces coryli]